MTDITVVIPAWRSREFVEAAIRSVQAQTLHPRELIVVDDASGDGTAGAARALGATVIEHESNQGVGQSRNDGISAANTEWIATLDADDEWLPHHLETLWEPRDQHVLVSAAAITMSDPRVLGWARRRRLILDSPAKAVVPEPCIRTSGVMFRREDAVAVGGFRPELPRAQDLDLWLRLLERGTGLALPVVTNRYRVHADQASADRQTGWQAQREILASYADRPWCTPLVRARRDAAIAWDEDRLRAIRNPANARVLAQLLLNRRAQRKRSFELNRGPRQ